MCDKDVYDKMYLIKMCDKGVSDKGACDKGVYILMNYLEIHFYRFDKLQIGY